MCTLFDSLVLGNPISLDKIWTWHTQLHGVEFSLLTQPTWLPGLQPSQQCTSWRKKKCIYLWRMNPKTNLEVSLSLHITDNYHVPCPWPSMSLHNCLLYIKFKHKVHGLLRLCIFVSKDSFVTQNLNRCDVFAFLFLVCLLLEVP